MDETNGSEHPVETPAASPDAPAPETGAALPTLSPLSALVGILTSPTTTFRSMRDARWHFAALPLALFALMAIVLSTIVPSRVDMGTFVREQLSQSRFADKMTSEQIEQAIESAQEKPSLVKSSLAFVIVPLFLMLVTLIYWVSLLAMGSTSKYWTAFNVVVWAHLPKILLKKILAVIILFVQDPANINPMNIVLSNPAAVLGYKTLSPFWYTVLVKCDVFALWTVILYIIGFGALSNLSKKQVAIVVIALVLTKTLLLASLGQFMGMYFYAGDVP